MMRLSGSLRLLWLLGSGPLELGVWVHDHAGHCSPTSPFFFHTELLRPQTPAGGVPPVVAVRFLTWLSALGVLRSLLAAWPHPFPLGYRLARLCAKALEHPHS